MPDAADSGLVEIDMRTALEIALDDPPRLVLMDRATAEACARGRDDREDRAA